MVKDELINFLEQIKQDFCGYLYEHEFFDERFLRHEMELMTKQRYQFPYCCILASNLISSYLNVHFDRQAKCVVSKGLPFNHSWCECPKAGIVIDYTTFQFKLDYESAERFKRYKLDKKEFNEFITKIQVIYEYEEHSHFPVEWIKRIDIENLGIESAKSIKENPFDKDTFMQYVRNVSDIINIKLEYQ